MLQLYTVRCNVELRGRVQDGRPHKIEERGLESGSGDEGEIMS